MVLLGWFPAKEHPMSITIKTGICSIFTGEGVAREGRHYCVEASSAGLAPGCIPERLCIQRPGCWPMELHLDRSSVTETGAVYRNRGVPHYALTVFND
jgi:hypothetical protein